MPRVKYVSYRPEMLRSVIERLDRLSGRLRAVMVAMEEDQLQELPIANHTSMIKGLDFAEKFGQAAERAVDNHRLGHVQTGD